MTFLQPWLLFCLPLVAVPLVIHLINQQRFQSVRLRRRRWDPYPNQSVVRLDRGQVWTAWYGASAHMFTVHSEDGRSNIRSQFPV